mmetsp:Transcript_8441/g.10678  ORF Transcript_8441/g.10678 Transcript_8441/m.10678 type:complete len:110 (+) Transcript_8441:79-408(+)
MSSSTSFASQLLSPGGGVLMIPFIRMVIFCLFCTTTIAFCFGVARVHMAILSCLAGGLLLSISFFLSEYETALEKLKRTGDVTSSDVRTSNTTTTAAATAGGGDRAKSD